MNHAALVSRLLQRMGSALRRKLIQTYMLQHERIALETYMRSLKATQPTLIAKAGGSSRVVKTPMPALCSASSSAELADKWELRMERGCGGIYKSAVGNKVYGYYAKAGLKNFIFCTRIQRELAGAVRDHIVLTKILENVRSNSIRDDLPAKVRHAVALVLAEEGLAEKDLLRSVTVGISAHHWIGRVLWVHRLQLEKALDVWTRHSIARGPPLFLGNKVTAEYTPKKSHEQWLRIRETFIQLQTEDGRASRSHVVGLLAKMETAYRPMFQRKTMHFQKLRHQQKTNQTRRLQPKMITDDPEILLHRFRRAIQGWRCAANAERSKRKRAESKKWQVSKKQRWDGKESIAEFQRRLEGEMSSKIL